MQSQPSVKDTIGLLLVMFFGVILSCGPFVFRDEIRSILLMMQG